jgi:hypothetical protein
MLQTGTGETQYQLTETMGIQTRRSDTLVFCPGGFLTTLRYSRDGGSSHRGLTLVLLGDKTRTKGL